jgi:hypothetical protein
MADYGFESNDDYDYQLRCLLNSPLKGIKTINVEGHKGRRKTAFANALGRALEYPHLFYYDFTQQGNIEGRVILPPSEDEHGIQAPPVSDFDHVLSETCAFSEGEQTVLIIDQLQAADFKDHIRIYHFIKDRQWSYSDTTLQANVNNLLLILLSEEPLYHSLQKSSFRLWINAVSTAQKSYIPADFERYDDILPVMEALGAVFSQLEVSPTFSEYKNILHDIEFHVHTEPQLIHSLYGWMEGINRELLYSRQMQPLLQNIIEQIQKYQGMDELVIETKIEN